MVRSAGCRNADKKCTLSCDVGKNSTTGKNETTEQENGKGLTSSAFDHHRAEIQQLEEEIKVNYAVN